MLINNNNLYHIHIGLNKKSEKPDCSNVEQQEVRADIVSTQNANNAAPHPEEVLSGSQILQYSAANIHYQVSNNQENNVWDNLKARIQNTEEKVFKNSYYGTSVMSEGEELKEYISQYNEELADYVSAKYGYDKNFAKLVVEFAVQEAISENTQNYSKEVMNFNTDSSNISSDYKTTKIFNSLLHILENPTFLTEPQFTCQYAPSSVSEGEIIEKDILSVSDFCKFNNTHTTTIYSGSWKFLSYLMTQLSASTDRVVLTEQIFASIQDKLGISARDMYLGVSLEHLESLDTNHNGWFDDLYSLVREIISPQIKDTELPIDNTISAEPQESDSDVELEVWNSELVSRNDLMTDYEPVQDTKFSEIQSKIQNTEEKVFKNSYYGTSVMSEGEELKEYISQYNEELTDYVSAKYGYDKDFAKLVVEFAVQEAISENAQNYSKEVMNFNTDSSNISSDYKTTKIFNSLLHILENPTFLTEPQFTCQYAPSSVSEGEIIEKDVLSVSDLTKFNNTQTSANYSNSWKFLTFLLDRMCVSQDRISLAAKIISVMQEKFNLSDREVYLGIGLDKLQKLDVSGNGWFDDFYELVKNILEENS